MAAAYPIDYPFNVNEEGWPEPVYDPPYPHEYYYDNGNNPDEIDPNTDQILQDPSALNKEHNHHYHHHHHHHHSHRPDSNYTLPLAIRRHTPGTTDPVVQQSTPRTRSPAPNAHVTVKQKPTRSNPNSVSFPKKTSVPLDPDERPIKPMKDISVYNKPSSPKKKTSLKTPLATPKIVQTPSRFESDSFQLPPSRAQTNSVSSRRPVRTDLIPKTPFGIPQQQQQQNRSRQIIVDDHYDYPVTYVKPVPKRIIDYQEVPGMTTRELENYLMSKPQRIVRVQSPPRKTIIYRT